MWCGWARRNASNCRPPINPRSQPSEVLVEGYSGFKADISERPVKGWSDSRIIKAWTGPARP